MPSNTTKYLDAIVLKIKTSSQWTSLNPVLLAGELGLESDTLRMKIGNGTDAWGYLDYTDQALRERISALEENVQACVLMVSAFLNNQMKGD